MRHPHPPEALEGDHQAMSSVATVKEDGARRTGRQTLFPAYLLAISIVGNALVLWGLVVAPSFQPRLNFLLLLVLSVAAQVTMTFTQRVGFSVGSAVSLAAVPLYGPLAAAVVTAATELGFGLFSLNVERPSWNQVVRRLTFNIGMNSIAVVLAGTFFSGALSWLQLGESDLVEIGLLWIVAAVINDQANMWMLIGIIYLQQGIHPREIWNEHKWAAPINIIVIVIGGGMLTIAAQQFDYLGIIIFFLPVLASAYAFRAYISETQKQMERLEEIVEARTRELATANADLAQLNVEKDAFLAVLSHDMRSPLSSILLSATLLREFPDAPMVKRSRFVDQIIRNQHTLFEMVSNILDIEQMKAGATIVLERQNVDLVQVVNELVLSLEAQAEEKEIDIQQLLPAAHLFIYVDEQKVRRVITNLISNAIKYTRDKGKVTIAVYMEAGECVIQVRDTGLGIPADELPHIFSRFRRVKQHETVAVGTGLGLAIVKSLVEAHGGTVEVESVEQVGSTFTVRLPA